VPYVTPIAWVVLSLAMKNKEDPNIQVARISARQTIWVAVIGGVVGILTTLLGVKVSNTPLATSASPNQAQMVGGEDAARSSSTDPASFLVEVARLQTANKDLEIRLKAVTDALLIRDRANLQLTKQNAKLANEIQTTKDDSEAEIQQLKDRPRFSESACRDMINAMPAKP
jgi:gas vesicle protein